MPARSDPRVSMSSTVPLVNDVCNHDDHHSKTRRTRPFLISLIGVLLLLLLMMGRGSENMIQSPNLNFSTTTTKNNNKCGVGGNQQVDDRIDFWWMATLKGTPVSLDLEKQGMFNFPSATKRVWIDVGVHRETDFMPHLCYFSTSVP